VENAVYDTWMKHKDEVEKLKADKKAADRAHRGKDAWPRGMGPRLRVMWIARRVVVKGVRKQTFSTGSFGLFFAQYSLVRH
jgi:hypothetical protein